MKKPLVSVYCTTYNHARYIKQTISSILKQETSFDYEIIIHDDASTDGTTRIVEELQSKHKSTIRTIIQDDNQYSKGLNPFYSFVLPEVRGRYIARCEGDDYWTNVHKLQRQIEFLEANPEYVACVHNTLIVNQRTHARRLLSRAFTERDLSVSSLVRENGSFHFSSLVERREVYDDLPEFVFGVPGAGDYPLRVYLGLKGQVRYLPHVMSVYRRGVPGSWTSRCTNDCKQRIDTTNNIIEMLKNADAWSAGKFHREFVDAIAEQRYNLDYFHKKYGNLLKAPNRDIFIHKRTLRHKCNVIGRYIISNF